jgi:hypothetical protein
MPAWQTYGAGFSVAPEAAYGAGFFAKYLSRKATTFG